MERLEETNGLLPPLTFGDVAVKADDGDVFLGDVGGADGVLDVVAGIWRDTEGDEGPGKGGGVALAGPQVQTIFNVLHNNIRHCLLFSSLPRVLTLLNRDVFRTSRVVMTREHHLQSITASRSSVTGSVQ